MYLKCNFYVKKMALSAFTNANIVGITKNFSQFYQYFVNFLANIICIPIIPANTVKIV